MPAFTKTTWNSGAAPGISAAELNRIEEGIFQKNEIWAGTALPTTDLYEGRTIFATSLTNPVFQNMLYVYRSGGWRLVSPIKKQAKSSGGGNVNTTANVQYTYHSIDFGTMPVAVNFRITGMAIMLVTTGAAAYMFTYRNGVEIPRRSIVIAANSNYYFLSHVLAQEDLAAGQNGLFRLDGMTSTAGVILNGGNYFYTMEVEIS